MLVTDRVHFIMPKDRELQFPAMSALSTYVNGYKQRTKMNDPSGGKAKFELEYSVEMAESDWQFFKRAGLVLDQEPVAILETSGPVPGWYGYGDMVANMSDDRINSFINNGKHSSSVCALMCGVAAAPLLNLRKVKPKTGSPSWASICSGFVETVPAGHEQPFTDWLLETQDERLTGVVGKAGVETYLAASMGLGVVEIQPVGRPRYWLSKWLNSRYRMVESDDPKLIGQAMLSIERTLT